MYRKKKRETKKYLVKKHTSQLDKLFIQIWTKCKVLGKFLNFINPFNFLNEFQSLQTPVNYVPRSSVARSHPCIYPNISHRSRIIARACERARAREAVHPSISNPFLLPCGKSHL